MFDPQTHDCIRSCIPYLAAHQGALRTAQSFNNQERQLWAEAQGHINGQPPEPQQNIGHMDNLFNIISGALAISQSAERFDACVAKAVSCKQQASTTLDLVGKHRASFYAKANLYPEHIKSITDTAKDDFDRNDSKYG